MHFVDKTQIILTLQQLVRAVITWLRLLVCKDEGNNIFRNVGSINQMTRRNIPEDSKL